MDLGKPVRKINVPEPVEAPTFPKLVPLTPVEVPTPEFVPVKRG